MEQLGIADLLYCKDGFRGPACHIPPWVELSDLPHLQNYQKQHLPSDSLQSKPIFRGRTSTRCTHQTGKWCKGDKQLGGFLVLPDLPQRYSPWPPTVRFLHPLLLPPCRTCFPKRERENKSEQHILRTANKIAIPKSRHSCGIVSNWQISPHLGTKIET